MPHNWHTYCPTGETSSCMFNRYKDCETSAYKPRAGLPLSVITYLKPIYRDLSRTDLLKKCLRGKTQNQNESFNAIIWEYIMLKQHTYRGFNCSWDYMMLLLILMLAGRHPCWFTKSLRCPLENTH